MSQGKLDYVYSKVQKITIKLKSNGNTPSQIAFGDDEKSIRNVFGKPKPKEVLDVLNYDVITLEDSDGKNFVGVDREDFGDLTERLIKLFDQNL